VVASILQVEADVQLPVVEELKRRRVFRALVAYGIAAFAVLQIVEPITHALHLHDPGLSYVKYDPLLRGLRDDQRYHALLTRMNFPVE